MFVLHVIFKHVCRRCDEIAASAEQTGVAIDVCRALVGLQHNVRLRSEITTPPINDKVAYLHARK